MFFNIFISSQSINYPFLKDLMSLLFSIVFSMIDLLMRCGDVHRNPGPEKKSKLSIIHWNLNSISSHNFEKLHLLQAFNSVYKYDLICLNETLLDTSYSDDDLDLSLIGYNMVRADHPDNVKRGGVSIFYKDTLPLKILDISQLSEFLAVEVAYEDEKCG